jgi:hypothetical protein
VKVLTDSAFLPTVRNADGSSRMLPILQYGMVPGDYVAIATVDLENSSAIGGVVRCELASVGGVLFARERQYVAPSSADVPGGGSLTLTAATFFPTGTTLNAQCATYAEGPTLPLVRGEARLILMPAQF